MALSAPEGFFALLRAGLWGATPSVADFPSGIDWSGALAMARRQAVAGLVADGASRLPAQLQPPAAVAAAQRKFALEVLRTHALLDNAIARLVLCLRSHGIEGVLLKGQGVARSYAQPLARQCGDIDLYVGPSLYGRAIEVACRELGADIGEYSPHGKHFHFKMGQVWVEIHRRAADMYAPSHDRKLQQWIASELEASPSRQRATFAGVETLLPSPNFNALFIFYHMWEHHLLGGVGLRQMCDWAAVLHRHASEIDRDELERNIRRFGLVRPWRAMAPIAVDILGLDPAEMPLYDPACRPQSRRILARMLQGGNFGAHARRLYTHRPGESLPARKLRTLLSLAHATLRAIPYTPAEALCMFATITAQALKTLFTRR